MSDFQLAFQETIGYEGGYSNNPSDYGGETKYGIAKRWYPNVDIKNLTLDEAQAIYFKDYWNPLLLGQIVSNAVATEIFEQAINMGKKQAATHAQRSVGLLGPPILVDGWFGNQTVAGINGLGARRTPQLMKCLNGYQFMKYLEIVENDASQRGFFVGWLKRIDMATK
jgi:lysozyme family protein